MTYRLDKKQKRRQRKCWSIRNLSCHRHLQPYRFFGSPLKGSAVNWSLMTFWFVPLLCGLGMVYGCVYWLMIDSVAAGITATFYGFYAFMMFLIAGAMRSHHKMDLDYENLQRRRKKSGGRNRSRTA